MLGNLRGFRRDCFLARIRRNKKGQVADQLDAFLAGISEVDERAGIDVDDVAFADDLEVVACAGRAGVQGDVGGLFRGETAVRLAPPPPAQQAHTGDRQQRQTRRLGDHQQGQAVVAA